MVNFGSSNFSLRLIKFSLFLGLGIASASADPVGAPGLPHRWAPASKQAIGTAFESTTAASPVWFTLAEGILTEVFYPTVDRVQVGDLQFIVTDGKGFFSEQKRDVITKVDYVDEGMAVAVHGQEKAGLYSFEQQIVSDPDAPVLRIKTTFHWNQPGLRVFVLFKPAIDNSGAGNSSVATAEGLFATKNPSGWPAENREQTHQVYAALVPSSPFISYSSGYVGFSDGWQDLSKNFKITEIEKEAGPGNIAMTGELAVNENSDFTYELSLGFGGSKDEAETLAQTSLSVPFQVIKENYENGWRGYVDDLQSKLNSKRFLSESTFVRRSAQIIKMHEDKRNPGAIVASLSNPSFDDDHAMDGGGGYHVVWIRDLYHAAMGLLAAGDSKTPTDVLKYMVARQSPDGSWPQNFWVDGTPHWRGLQMDEVSFPILLAAQLQNRNVYKLQSSEIDMVKKAAAFIASHGPSTMQDRWEELGGYVPSTIAAEVAALRAATILTQDPSFAAVGNQWQSMIERWTLAPQGIWGQNYYMRVSPNGTPESPDSLEIPNGTGKAYATDILDGGFLDLVRLGIRTPSDPRILTTLNLYDDTRTGIAATDSRSPAAMTYHRYNHDGYGENHVGGYWPLLAGERGHYAILAGDLDQAKAQLFIVEKSANETGLLPEQTEAAPITQSPGNLIGLGVACPLVWAHAEDILLHRSLEEGNVFDAPRSGP